jgi:hypothetical protein
MGNGSTYVDIHTEQNPNGEIRGQISGASLDVKFDFIHHILNPSLSSSTTCVYAVILA